MPADPELVKGTGFFVQTLAKIIVPAILILGVITIGFEVLHGKLKKIKKHSKVLQEIIFPLSIRLLYIGAILFAMWRYMKYWQQ